MSPRLTAALAKLDSRVLLGGLLFIGGLVAGEGWMLVLSKPFSDYRALIAASESLSASRITGTTRPFSVPTATPT